MDRHQWWVIAGLMSLLISIGCSHEQVATATPEVVASEASVVSTEVAPADKSFVRDENLQPVYFELSQSHLDEQALEQAKRNAEWLEKNPLFMVQVTGYTDNRGSSKKNHWLAERRAVQLRDAYVAAGVSKNRMLVKAVGEEGPACGHLTEECLSQSRRAETLIENKAVALSAPGSSSEPIQVQ
jgi:outer membrane protein OmpA-like peptidoglycan-associated protein